MAPAASAPTRRHFQRLLGAAALGGLLPTLGACAAGSGAPGYTVSRQRLNELLAHSFPVTRALLGGLAELTLTAPRVQGHWKKQDLLGCIHEGSLNKAISDIEARVKKR